MKDRCIVNSIRDICSKCPDKLVQEVKVERYGLAKLLDPLTLAEGETKTIPTGKDACTFPRAVRLKIEGARVDSIDGLGRIMPQLLELDVQRNHIKSIDAKTLPRRLSTLKLDGNPIERIDNAQSMSMLEHLSLANAAGTINIDWIKDLDRLNTLNLSNKHIIPPVYRTGSGKIEKAGKKLGPKEIKELKEYLRQYPVEIEMAEREAKTYDDSNE